MESALGAGGRGFESRYPDYKKDRKGYYKSTSGCSAVRLAHLLWEQGVPGSNPGIPTKLKEYQLVTYKNIFFLSRSSNCL